MGFVNRIIVATFSIVALIVGAIGWLIFIGILSPGDLDTKLGIMGWIILGVIWMMGAFKVLAVSLSSFNAKSDLGDERLVTHVAGGEMILTIDVVQSFVREALAEFDEIIIMKIVPFFKKENMDVTIQLKVDGNQDLPELTNRIKQRVSEKMKNQTGVSPKNISVEILKLMKATDEIQSEEIKN